MLFGKSHFKKAHPLLERKPVPEAKAFEQSTTPIAQTIAKQFRAGPLGVSSARIVEGKQYPVAVGEKRKHQYVEIVTPTRSVKQCLTPKQHQAKPQHPSRSMQFDHQVGIVKPAVAIPAHRADYPPRRYGDYYVNKEGETCYDKPKGWHPDDGDESD